MGPKAQDVSRAVDTQNLPTGVEIPVLRVGRFDNGTIEELVDGARVDELPEEDISFRVIVCWVVTPLVVSTEKAQADSPTQKLLCSEHA